MRDGPVRRTVKLLARICFRLDSCATRAVLWTRGGSFFNLQGACNHCGRCCETPAFQVHSLLFHVPVLRRLLLLWHERVNGFRYMDQDRADHTLIFRCTHWDNRSRRCDSYASRPGMCRDYPKALLSSVRPEFFDTCSYWPILKRADSLNERLADLDLPPETLRELQRRLFLASPDPGTDDRETSEPTPPQTP